MLTRTVLFLGLLTSFAIAQVTSADIQTFLGAHNTVRSRHGAAPLAWDSTLAEYAQEWAATCSSGHSPRPSAYGENIFEGTASAYGISYAVQSWADETSEYDPNLPVASHFTQVVWKSTTLLGCGVQVCGSIRHIACEYSPPGNSGNYSANVDP